jgi:hypothetical protein
MADIWALLEQRSRAWHTLDRQGLADAIWADYVWFRFGRTGDPRALEYLYPYLNHAERETRLRAIAVAARVFEGRGPQAVGDLDYFTRHPDPFLRDRAVCVVGAAVKGSSPRKVILETLGAYLNHRNQFIRKQALVALGRAAAGSADETVLGEIRRVGGTPGPRPDEVDLAIATVFAGRPTEEAYGLVAKPQLADRIDTGNERAVSVLVRGASEPWYERAYTDCFEPRLHAGDDVGWQTQFIHRDGIHGLSRAGTGRGMDPLGRMLHLRHRRCTCHAMMRSGQKCFIGADREANRGPLIELARSGDVPAQRLAAVCLGRLTSGAEDADSTDALRRLCDAKSKAIQAAALYGLGLAARSTCDRDLRRLCLQRAADEQTAPAAIRALGTVFLGSGSAEVLKDIRRMADQHRARPVRGKRYSKPLAACYIAAGLLYLGTGSAEPVEFLLDVLAMPRRGRHGEYHWCAARALVMVEFSEAALGWPYILGS